MMTNDIPENFLREVMSGVGPYSVAIARARDNDAQTFRPLGTGIFVKKGGRFGILTAHHCLHAFSPEVQLGASDGDQILLILHRGRQVVVNPIEAIEIPLALPHGRVYGEFGPDLTFIQILSDYRRTSIAAVGSFWNLDREPKDVIERWGKIKTPIASVGFPGVDYRTKIEKNDVHHLVKKMLYANAIGEGDVYSKDGWDYIDLTCTYTDTNNLPDDFGGVSGGPVWAYEMRKENGSGELVFGDFGLVGMKFFQTPKKDNRCKLRAHYAESIYDTAWRDCR